MRDIKGDDYAVINYHSLMQPYDIEIVEREMTADEAAQYEKDVAAAKEQKTAQEALEAKKQEVLAKLGLTSDEVAALLA